MNYTIKNEYLTASISSLGAELISLIDSDGINRMHTPNPKTWNRVSPILFPQVSRTPGFKYKVNGIEYNMPAHGFFRNIEHTPVLIDDTTIKFVLKDNEETLKMYPYNFEFSVTYSLKANQLIVSFDVENKSNKTMLYMLGGHPGFKAPLFDNETYENYYLKFEHKETVDAMQVVEGFLANVYKPCLKDANIIKLDHNIFNPDAIVMRGLKSKYVDLLSDLNNKSIRFYFSDFEILAVWSLMNNEANYVCLEPWNGIQKNFVEDHEKMGVLQLLPNEKSHYSFTIEVN
jgi:galactose mutarotase-like enzyme